MVETEQRTAERRRIARQKSFLRGMIYFNNRRNAVDCLVRDISPYGARLIFSDAVTTPDVLDLYIPQKEQTLRVNVIWRHGQEVGVAFAQAASMEPAADPADPGSVSGPSSTSPDRSGSRKNSCSLYVLAVNCGRQIRDRNDRLYSPPGRRPQSGRSLA
jgi:hypothetical protein